MTDTKPRLPRWAWWLLATILVGALAGGGYYWWQQQQQPGGNDKGGEKAAGKRGAEKGARATPVAATAARKSDVKVYLSGLGTVTPLRIVTVRSRVDGQLMRVLFREGQMVKEGELLAEIDSRQIQAQLTQAEGQMLRDQALLANARIDFERYRTLLAQDSIAKQLVDTQEALVRQYEGTVKVDQGVVDNARLQLTYSRLTAPISGRLGLRAVDPGNIVRSSDTNGLVVITQQQPISVIYTIPQDNLQTVLKALKSGERVPVEAYDRDQKVKLGEGALLTTDNQIDTATGTVRLRAQLANEDGTLFPNQFVNIRMLVETRRDVTTVPSAAVQRGSQGIFVYVVKDDLTVTLRLVKLGPVDGEMTTIESGVEPGELVVTDGADRLREGSKVVLPDRSAVDKKGDGARKKGGGNRKRDDGDKARKAAE